MGDNTDWEDYYIPPSLEVINKGRENIKGWDVQYATILDMSLENLQHELKHAPLRAIIPGHAVLHFNCPSDLKQYFDSYQPFSKVWQPSFHYVVKIVLTKKVDRLVTVTSDVYRVKDGKKDLFLNAASFAILDGRWDKIEKITQQELDAIPTGNVLIAVAQE